MGMTRGLAALMRQTAQESQPNMGKGRVWSVTSATWIVVTGATVTIRLDNVSATMVILDRPVTSSLLSPNIN